MLEKAGRSTLFAALVLISSPGAAQPVDEPSGFAVEPRAIERTIDFASLLIGDRSDRSSGFYPDLANMVTGAGWISIGPGYRYWFPHDRALFDASAALSWRSYKTAQARFELPKLAHSRIKLGSQIAWRDLTQITYFGPGPDSSDARRSEYRLRTLDLVAYSAFRPVQWLAINASAGWLRPPAVLRPGGTFQRGNPAAVDVFPSDPVFARHGQPAYLHRELSVVADTRDSRSHPSHGAVYRLALTQYADRDTAGFSFARYEAEAARFTPLANDRVVLALHGWMIVSDTASGALVPFYLLPSLGGNNTLRAYGDFRFHDRNLLAVNVESRFAVFTHVDAALFADAGNVAARASDLGLAKRCYGVGVRMHTRQATFARLDAAHGADGWRFLFRINDPLHLSRLSRHHAAAPFVP